MSPLLENPQAYDFGNEIFDSGPDSFDKQWGKIHQMQENDRGFTSSEEED